MAYYFQGPWFRKEAGLTFPELLIVLSVVAILTGMAAIHSDGLLQGTAVRGAARQVYSDLQMARMRALKEGMPWAVQFSDQHYSIRNSGPDGIWGTGDDVVTRTVDLESAYRKTGITTVDFSSERAVFYANGTASGGGVHVAAASGVETLEVLVIANTGHIRIQ